MLRLLLVASITTLLMLSSSCERSPHAPPDVLFDAEMSSNDLMTLYVLNKSLRANLVGVTVSGAQNNPFKQAAVNAERVLMLTQDTKIPVAALSSPMFCPPASFPQDWVNPTEDLSIYHLPTNTASPLSIDGSTLMEEVLSRATQKVTIFCLGPLNNLAHLLIKTPSIKDKIARVVMIGGSLHTTQEVVLPFHVAWKEASLYNTFSDPCSANIVLTSGLPITLIPLDVITMVRDTQEILDTYIKSPPKDPGARFVVDVLKEHSMTKNTFRGFAVFWDMIALMSIIEPKILTFETAYLTIETNPGPLFGYIIPDGVGHPVDLCTSIDYQRFFELFFSIIGECTNEQCPLEKK